MTYLLIIASLVIGTLLYFCTVRYRPHLHKIPGPFSNSISHLPRLFSVAKGSAHLDAILLHQRYGPVVRVGPNHVSFSDPEALSVVYSISSKFEKSNFYMPFDAKTPHAWVPTIFSVRSERAHKDIKRPIAGAYSMTSLLELEGLTDDCIRILCNKLNEKLEVCSTIGLDLGEWLHWYAFDLITSITFSNKIGFMEKEEDVESIISAIEGRLKYNSTIGQWPVLHKLLIGNNFVSKIISLTPGLRKLNTGSRIVEFTVQQLRRYETRDKEKVEYTDMLDRFRKVSNSGDVLMTYQDVLMAALGNIFAGSDTTAISLRSMFYYLLKNPRCLRLLQTEIDTMDNAGELSQIVTFAESQKMPYMQACLKEAMRMHPAVGLMLERIVPEAGIEIAGYHLPAGTVIGANPWVVARDKKVYGKDADEFRPERWLDLWNAVDREAEASSTTGIAKEKLRQMERNFLAFGMGSRTCLGKNVSLLEMNKLVPQMLRLYDFELVDPQSVWKVENYWFTKQLGLSCEIRGRLKGCWIESDE